MSFESFSLVSETARVSEDIYHTQFIQSVVFEDHAEDLPAT